MRSENNRTPIEISFLSPQVKLSHSFRISLPKRLEKSNFKQIITYSLGSQNISNLDYQVLQNILKETKKGNFTILVFGKKVPSDQPIKDFFGYKSLDFKKNQFLKIRVIIPKVSAAYEEDHPKRNEPTDGENEEQRKRK